MLNLGLWSEIPQIIHNLSLYNMCASLVCKCECAGKIGKDELLCYLLMYPNETLGDYTPYLTLQFYYIVFLNVEYFNRVIGFADNNQTWVRCV